MKKYFLKFYHWSGTWTGTLVIVLSIIFFIAQAFIIPTGSMKNTLLVGDMLFVKKFAYGLPTPTIPWLEIKVLPDFNGDGHLIKGDGPKRGDIVVFYAPKEKEKGNNVYYVKRCVAVGGDILFIKDKDLYLHYKEGNEYIEKHFSKDKIVSVGDKLFVKNPYSNHKGVHHDKDVIRGIYPEPIFNTPFIEVEKDHYFMMGDNRDHSNDSRFWGSVPYKYIVGKPWFVYMSFDKDYKIRWERVFTSIDYLESISHRYEKKHQKGLY